jgi:sporulation protein YlmC with PRC-barrel domain
MIRASDLIGSVVRTESGKTIGRVHDLRANTIHGDCLLTGLVVGRGGMLARFTGGGATAGPTHGGDIIPWQAITKLEDGHITIRDKQD